MHCYGGCTPSRSRCLSTWVPSPTAARGHETIPRDSASFSTSTTSKAAWVVSSSAATCPPCPAPSGRMAHADLVGRPANSQVHLGADRSILLGSSLVPTSKDELFVEGGRDVMVGTMSQRKKHNMAKLSHGVGQDVPIVQSPRGDQRPPTSQ